MHIITPYQGKLITLISYDASFFALERIQLREKAKTLKTIPLSARSLCDFELLATGAFSPLNQFMNRADYESVLDSMRLANGVLFPIPITLPISDKQDVQVGEQVALVDQYNNPLAIMHIEEKYTWNKEHEAQAVLKTLDHRHPLVNEMEHWGKFYISGKLEVFDLPHHADFETLRFTPAELRKILGKMNKSHVVAFQTRNPMHMAHEELTKRAMKELNAVLLLQPVVGLTKPFDVDYYTRVRIYKTLINKYYPKNEAILSLLPLAMRMAGPREALWHAIMRRNFGADHFIVGRDHAGPGTDSKGKPFYEPYEAQEIVQHYEKELGIKVVPFKEFVYLPDEKRYEDRTKIPQGKKYLTLSGTEVREKYLKIGKLLPSWFTRKECAAILAETHPAKYQRGLCLWFTGLPCAGKTTIAKILAAKLNELGKTLTYCDGDVTRKHLAQELGFSLEDRIIHLKRISFIATEVVKHKGIIIVSVISPLQKTRDQIRNEISSQGNFVEIFVDTPLEVCQMRDIKGMYAKAKRGEIKDYTGINSPYEPPENAEITLHTDHITPEANANIVLNYLKEKGLIKLKKNKITL